MLIHSDKGSQFTSMDLASFLKHHNLVHSIRRRGNCHDRGAESFFNRLKRKRMRRRVYHSRDEARKDMLDYVEIFYTRNASSSVMGCCRLSSLRTSRKSFAGGVYKTRGC